MEETIFMEPPNYYITDIIFDIDFHPTQSILSLGTINGDIQMLNKKTILQYRNN